MTRLFILALFGVCLTYVLGENDCESRVDGGKPCPGAYVYGYDSRRKDCIKFYFYGSNGNRNQFETQKECQDDCLGDDPSAACDLDIAYGKRCYSNRWFFASSGYCSMFGYQGTGGNGNNYKTKEECEEACKKPAPTTDATPSGENDCKSRPDGGKPCASAGYVYGYDSRRKDCIKFYFYGSNGNRNQFKTQKECQDDCLGDDPSAACELSIAIGKRCYSNRWYFGYGSCRQFGYYGAGGNGNNYKTKEECEEACKEDEEPVVTRPRPNAAPTTGAPPTPSGPDCLSRPDGGKPCVGAYVYGYSARYKHCIRFYFYGKDGNDNQFETKKECDEACSGDDLDDACEQDIANGKTCYSNRWYYGYGSCRQFGYQGTGGNGNNFKTKEECEEACKEDEEPVVTTPSSESAPDCSARPDGGKPCPGAYVYGYDARYKRCIRFYFYGKDGNDNQFKTQKECDEACSGDDLDDACEQEIARGKTCYSNRWYFGYGSCRQFGYQGTGGNGNNFKTKEECEEACKEDEEPVVTTPSSASGSDCSSRPDGGKPCPGAYVYGYDARYKRCIRFYFYGKDGNDNQFETQKECDEACSGDDLDDACEQEIARGKTCYSNRWYFGHGSCRRFGYQGTGGNGNNFETQEECEKACAKE